MNYALDLILAGVMVVFVILGVHRGLVRSAARFVGAWIAAFLASALGGVAARWVFELVFREALARKVADTMSAAGTESLSDSLRSVLASLPDFLVRVLEENGITASVLEGMLAHSTGKAAELVTDAISPMFIAFLKVLAALVLFALFTVLVRVLSDMLGKMFRLPVLRQVDGILGGVFGLLQSAVVIWVLISAVQVFFPMFAPDTRADVEIALNHSIIAGWFVNFNPLAAAFH